MTDPTNDGIFTFVEPKEKTPEFPPWAKEGVMDKLGIGSGPFPVCLPVETYYGSP